MEMESVILESFISSQLTVNLLYRNCEIILEMNIKCVTIKINYVNRQLERNRNE